VAAPVAAVWAVVAWRLGRAQATKESPGLIATDMAGARSPGS
jgi:hypothetical protein